MQTASAVTTQGRVLWALMLREVHTLYGASTLGYFWAVVQTGFGVGVFWALRSFVGAKAPHGMSVLVFLAAGFLVWNIFSQSISKCVTAYEGNVALLIYPQVTPLDILVARVIVVMATEVLAVLVLLGIGLIFGYETRVQQWGGVFFVLLLATLWSMGSGLLVASLAAFWPTLAKLVPMFLRVLFFMSGVFFSVSAFSRYIGDVLLWNPVLQFIEWLRQSMSSSYVAPDLDIFYLVSVTFCTLCLGLLLERYARVRTRK